MQLWRLAGSRSREIWCFNLSLRAGKSQSSSDRKDSLLIKKGSEILLQPGLWLIKWDPPILGRAMWFTQSTNLSVLLSSKNTLTEIPRKMLGQISGYSMAPSRWHEINHHTYHYFFNFYLIYASVSNAMLLGIFLKTIQMLSHSTHYSTTCFSFKITFLLLSFLIHLEQVHSL